MQSKVTDHGDASIFHAAWRTSGDTQDCVAETMQCHPGLLRRPIEFQSSDRAQSGAQFRSVGQVENSYALFYKKKLLGSGIEIWLDTRRKAVAVVVPNDSSGMVRRFHLQRVLCVGVERTLFFPAIDENHVHFPVVRREIKSIRISVQAGHPALIGGPQESNALPLL